jgi:hypothetical protein
MKRERSSWLTLALLSAARRVLPRERRQWADAMKAELFNLPPHAARRWAFGCFVAAIKQRLSPMHTGTFRINRWIMLVEVLGCFGFVTLAYYEFMFGPSGLVRLNGEMIEKAFLGSPAGKNILVQWFCFAITGLVGPIGLWLGLRYVLLNRALQNRTLGIVLIAGPVLQSILAAIGTIWMGTADYSTGLGLFVLFTVLPILGVLHLRHLARPVAPTPTDARLAVG